MVLAVDRHLAGALMITVCLHGCLCMSGAERVLTQDGRQLQGTVRQAGAALVVESASPRRDIYLSPAVVSERVAQGAQREVEPEFLFHQEFLKEKRKGTIAPVVEDIHWGTWSPDGTTEIQMKDPALGAVSFRVFVSRVTPHLTELQGVEYTWPRSFPTAQMAGLVLPMVERQVGEATSAAAWLKLASFHRLRGDAAAVERALAGAQRAGATEEACSVERQLLNLNAFEERLDELHSWMTAGREEEALREAALLETPSALAESDPIRYRQISARLTLLQKRAEDYREALAELARRKLPFRLLTPEQAARLTRALRTGPTQIEEKSIPALCEAWAEGFADANWDAATLEEAKDLAAAVATFFAERKPAAIPELAGRMRTSRLPFAVKVSILRHATRFPDPPADAVSGWHRVEHQPTGTQQACHYYVSVPPTYRPDTPTPVVVALHGQHGTAESMKHFGEQEVVREGWILISPEYIYGRKWGYNFSTVEHLAVLEAVRHAGGYLNIDMDRVFLTGVSQGGHATWDMGPAHAGFFAAVVPIIGAPLIPDHWPNLHDTSLYAIDGSLDGKAPLWNRRAMQTLAFLRTDATYVEYIDRGHEGFAEEFGSLFAWLRTKRRTRVPEVNLVACRRMELRRRWIDVLATREPLEDQRIPMARAAMTRVDGRIKPGNQIELHASNATRLRVLIAPEGVDLEKPVTIRVNGRQAFRGMVRLDWVLALRESLTRHDRCDVYVAEVPVEGR